jgi:hypothetical protein
MAQLLRLHQKYFYFYFYLKQHFQAICLELESNKNKQNCVINWRVVVCVEIMIPTTATTYINIVSVAPVTLLSIKYITRFMSMASVLQQYEYKRVWSNIYRIEMP